MQFKSIAVVLSFALAAAATPTGGSTKTGPICKPTQTPVYCTNKSSSGGTGGLIGNLLGGGVLTNLLNCVTIIPILSGTNVANACCDTSGIQNGVVNVGTICAPIQV